MILYKKIFDPVKYNYLRNCMHGSDFGVVRTATSAADRIKRFGQNIKILLTHLNLFIILRNQK